MAWVNLRFLCLTAVDDDVALNPIAPPAADTGHEIDDRVTSRVSAESTGHTPLLSDKGQARVTSTVARNEYLLMVSLVGSHIDASEPTNVKTR